jgi:hypothetical protein
MKFQDLQNRISEYFDTLDFPESKKNNNLIKKGIEEKWKNELINLSLNEDFTFISFSEFNNSIEVDEIENYNKDVDFGGYYFAYEKNIKYYLTTNYFVEKREFKIDNNIISDIRTLNKGDKININLKFLEFNCLYEKQKTTYNKDKKIENIYFSDNKIFSFEIIFIIDSLKIINKIEYQKINLFQLKEKISNYCNQFNLPKNEIEHVEFKKVFDHNWKKEIQFLLFEDILTLQKKDFRSHYDVQTYFIETEFIHPFIFRFNYNTEIQKLNDGDKINIKFKIISIETISINNYGKTETIYSLNFEINSFDIVEKFEIKKLEEKILKKEETEIQSKDDRTNEIISTNNNINQIRKTKSFNDLLDFFIELESLSYNSRRINSSLNSFQNKVFNEKNLNEYNSKKEIFKKYNGLEFNTICEVTEIQEQTIDFKLYYRNKVFFFKDSNYDKNLRKEVFFLKNNSSVKINFKINEIKHPFVGSINIELLSIKKNNKIKLFGKFISLEILYIGIYIFLLIYTLILFSKNNYVGYLSLLIKLTLWIGFWYLFSKFVVKYLYKK